MSLQAASILKYRTPKTRGRNKRVRRARRSA